MGATRTDFTMIQAGAIHRANGGYLVMPARDLLLSPYTWEGLKRVLRDGEIRIIEIGQLIGLLSSVTLEPDPIPLNVKVILIGTPMFYYLLRTYDEDFAKLFKVNAEYATTMNRTEDTEHEYGLYIKSVVMDNQLPPFDREAVARIIEYSARLAEDQEKLSARFGKIADLVREAAYWAKKKHPGEGHLIVGEQDVQQAIDEWVYRNNLIDELLQEMVADGTLILDVSGRGGGADQCPIRHDAGRLHLRAPQAGDRIRISRLGWGGGYRAPGAPGRRDPYQRGADPDRLPGQPLRARPDR